MDDGPSHSLAHVRFRSKADIHPHSANVRQHIHDRCRESRGMAWMRRSYEIAIDYDRRILHPSCAGGFSVRLHDQLRERNAVVEARHATARYNLRAGCQHRSPADTSDHTASGVNVLYEPGYARIFGKQGWAPCTARNKDTNIVLGSGISYRAFDIQQAGSRKVAVNLDRLLARGHHLDLVASFVECHLGKEVLLLLKCIGNKRGNLALAGHEQSPYFN